MKAFIRAFIVLVVVAAIAGGVVAYSIARRGLSARTEPSQVEELVARTMRRLATPREVRSMTNPVEPTEAVLTEGLEHFADHCASCHANDGSGDTEIGRSLYPRAPDMRAGPTQELSDGELFSIIENGVRLTGMPAWGTGTFEGQRAKLGTGALHQASADAHGRRDCPHGAVESEDGRTVAGRGRGAAISRGRGRETVSRRATQT